MSKTAGIFIVFIFILALIVIASLPKATEKMIMQENLICEATEFYGCGAGEFVNEEGDTMTGNLNFTQGNQPYYNVTKEIDIPISLFKLPGINPPKEDIIGIFPVLKFDAAQNESAYANVHVPENYYQGTDWSFVVYWAPADAGAGDVLFCVEIVDLTPNTDDLLTNSTHTSCVLDSTETRQYEMLRTAKISFSETDTLIDDNFGFRFFRGADDPSDTYTADAIVIDSTVYYQVNKAGIS